MAHLLNIYGFIGIDDDLWGIDGFTAKQLTKFLDSIEEDDDHDIDVHINSGGGYVSDAVAIYNRLRGWKGHVKVTVDGLAASAASLIAMAGDHIVMPRSALMMIHNPWGYAVGESDDMRDAADRLDVIQSQMITIYAKRSGMDEEEVEELLDAETWMTGDSALELGFIDRTDEEEDSAIIALAATASYEYQLAIKAGADVPKYDAIPGELLEELGQQAAASLMNPGFRLIGPMSTRKKEDSRPSRPAANVPKTAREKKMSMKGLVGSRPKASAATAPAVGRVEEVDVDVDEVRAKARKDERKRVTSITALCSRHGIEDNEFIDELIDGDFDLASAKGAILDKIAASAPVESRLHIEVGVGESENLAKGVENAILMRLGHLSPTEMASERRGNPYTACTLAELAMKFVVPRSGESRLEAIGRALVRPRASVEGAITHGTQDFPGVLENIVQKQLLFGWEAAGQTFAGWTNRGNLTDYRKASRAGLNTISTLDEIAELGEYTGTSVGDRKVEIQLKKYGNLLGLSREALLDDDMSVFSDLPRALGSAAARTVSRHVYKILADNPNFDGATALFAVGRSNTRQANFDKAGVQLARAAMRTQVSPAQADEPLAIEPAFLIVPAALELSARELLESTIIKDGDAGVSNVSARSLQLVVEPRLDLYTPAQGSAPGNYYVSASGSLYDTIEVAYLNGVEVPTLEAAQGFNVDGMVWKVRHEFAVAIRDFRGLQRCIPE
jgi:ATP-dependent Clp endopeptidase proteolytic subunit ClpP